MRTLKPVLGQKKVVVKDIIKKGTDNRFTITLKMQVVDSTRELTDVLFYDEANTTRKNVLPAIFRALADQIELEDKEWITEEGEEIVYNENKLLEELKGKEITIERTQVTSERNGQVYYNINYRPEIVLDEDEVEL